jgi:alkanesulfonate monooxygenase SsuD/methylene tetrahydromethanopterin reductase-like flavin-dependent oxidoreductase (luciferase family)
MRVFNMVLFGWSKGIPTDVQVGLPGSYPLSNQYFDPLEGQRILKEFIEQIELCDALGFDGVNMQEHHGNGAFCAFVPSTTVMAAALALHTRNLKIGVTGTCLPLHNPISIAEEVAMVDHLCQGRLIWGALRGFPNEYLAYSINPAESQARFREAFELIIKIWTTVGPANFEGRYYRARNYNIWPRTLQQPYPKVWMACNSMDSIDFAVETRSYLMTPWVPNEQARKVYDGYKQLAAERGIELAPDFDDMFAGVSASYCAETDEQARAECEAHLSNHFSSALAAFDSNTTSLIPGHMSPRGLRTWLEVSKGKSGRSLVLDFDEAIEGGTLIVGSPATCVELIRRLRGVGKHGTMLSMFQFGTLPHELVMKSVGLFGRNVLPAIRDI